MSKDRKIDDAELANISGAGDVKDLAGAGGSGGSDTKPGGIAEVTPPGASTGGDAPDTDDTGSDNQNLGG